MAIGTEFVSPDIVFISADFIKVFKKHDHYCGLGTLKILFPFGIMGKKSWKTLWKN